MQDSTDVSSIVKENAPNASTSWATVVTWIPHKDTLCYAKCTTSSHIDILVISESNV